MNYYISRKVLLLCFLLCSTQNASSMFHSPDECDEESLVGSNSTGKSKEPLLNISTQIEQDPPIIIIEIKNKFQEFIELPTHEKVLISTAYLWWGLWTGTVVWNYHLLFKK